MKIKLAAAGFAAALSLATISGAMAAKPDVPPGKTTICHATASATNPYVIIEISNAALNAHLFDPGHNKPSGNPDGLSIDPGEGDPFCRFLEIPGS